MTTKITRGLLDEPVTRNLFVNGALGVNQRLFTTVALGSGGAFQFGADMLAAYMDSSGGATLSRHVLDFPTLAQAGSNLYASVKLTCTTADTSLVAPDQLSFLKFIEGYDYYDFIENRICTLSFWCKSNKTGTYGVQLSNTDGSRKYFHEYTIDVADVWEKKTLTVDFANIGGTWDYSSGKGLSFEWILMKGGPSTSTLNTWLTSSTATHTSNQVNLMDTVSNYFAIAGLQFEQGVFATPLIEPTRKAQIEWCQRYFQLSPRLYGHCFSTTELWLYWQFATRLRAAPDANRLALTTTTPVGESLPWTTTITATGATMTNTHREEDACDLRITGFTGLTANAPAILRPGYIWAASDYS